MTAPWADQARARAVTPKDCGCVDQYITDQRARAMLPGVETPGALKTAEDALHVAAAGYIRVGWLDDKPADKSNSESTVRRLLETDQREARRG